MQNDVVMINQVYSFPILLSIVSFTGESLM
jgi:hypothetical protein